MPWIEPFVSWLANHIPTKDDFNRIEGNILHLNDDKVSKVAGKDLSTNDYTTTEKNKLAGIEAGATADMSANEILDALKTVDGVGSGLDADTLDGKDSSEFAEVVHSHSGYAPTSHASSGTSYGVGTTANHGHVKTINSLTQASHINGTALSAYQGKVLKDLIDNAILPELIASINITTTGVEITDYLIEPYDFFIIEVTGSISVKNNNASSQNFKVGFGSSVNATTLTGTIANWVVTQSQTAVNNVKTNIIVMRGFSTNANTNSFQPVEGGTTYSTPYITWYSAGIANLVLNINLNVKIYGLKIGQ